MTECFCVLKLARDPLSDSLFSAGGSHVHVDVFASVFQFNRAVPLFHSRSLFLSITYFYWPVLELSIFIFSHFYC